VVANRHCARFIWHSYPLFEVGVAVQFVASPRDTRDSSPGSESNSCSVGACFLWEDTGIIGAGLWLATMLVLALSLRRMGKDLARGSSGRFLYFVALGFLCGCCVSSMGEAWVLSPSPETAVFWATMGIGFGALKADANSTSSMGAAA